MKTAGKQSLKLPHCLCGARWCLNSSVREESFSLSRTHHRQHGEQAQGTRTHTHLRRKLLYSWTLKQRLKPQTGLWICGDGQQKGGRVFNWSSQRFQTKTHTHTQTNSVAKDQLKHVSWAGEWVVASVWIKKNALVRPTPTRSSFAWEQGRASAKPAEMIRLRESQLIEGAGSIGLSSCGLQRLNIISFRAEVFVSPRQGRRM